MVRLWAAGFIVAAMALGAEAAPQSSVTFNKDVLPILQQNCQSCHRPGQVAPMSFLTYRDVRPWAKSIKTVAETRKMPPWNADPTYGHFLNDRSLKQSEIDALVAWVDGGAIEGDPKDALPPKEWPAGGWQVQPDLIIETPDFDVPATGVIDWFWETVRKGHFSKDTYITSIQFQPVDAAVLHHIGIAFVPHTSETQYNVPIWQHVVRDANGDAIPGKKPVPGNPGAPDIGSVLKNAIGGGFQDTYVPGHTISDYRPFGAARFIPADTDVYLNLHFTTNGHAIRTHVRVGFTFAKEVPKRQVVMLTVGGPTDRDHFHIPANDADYAPPVGQATFKRDVEIFTLMPHMHVRGKSWTFALTYPDGKTETILNVPHYDFNWQLQYDTAIKVPKGATLRAEAHYDNSTGNRYNPNPNEDVYYGQQTWEEMEDGYVFLLVDDPNFDPRHPDLVEKSTRQNAATAPIG